VERHLPGVKAHAGERTQSQLAYTCGGPEARGNAVEKLTHAAYELRDQHWSRLGAPPPKLAAPTGAPKLSTTQSATSAALRSRSDRPKPKHAATGSQLNHTLPGPRNSDDERHATSLAAPDTNKVCTYVS
jgi:hypothetical protein